MATENQTNNKTNGLTSVWGIWIKVGSAYIGAVAILTVIMTVLN